TGDVSLVTGFPSFVARRLARRLLETSPKERVHLLTPADARGEMESFLAALPVSHRKRIQVLEGDVTAMDLGLGGAEYKALAADVTAIYHTAARYHLGAKREEVAHVNVDGTRTVLDFAGDARTLRRLVHWSSAQVSGSRGGVILEEELVCGQR